VTVGLANSPGVTLNGTLSEPDQNGVATFSGLSINTSGSYQIQATSGSLTKATSNTFVVSAATASKLAFGQQPPNASAGAAISPAVTIEVEDKYSNVVTSDNSTVTLTLSSGTFEGGSTTASAAA